MIIKITGAEPKDIVIIGMASNAGITSFTANTQG